LTVMGADTIANATTYLDTLAMSKCGLVVAVGDAETGALVAQAHAFPSVDFLAVGSVNAAYKASNVAVVPRGEAKSVTAAVAAVVERASTGRFSAGAKG